jgi:hypothetical protein
MTRTRKKKRQQQSFTIELDKKHEAPTWRQSQVKRPHLKRLGTSSHAGQFKIPRRINMMMT